MLNHSHNPNCEIILGVVPGYKGALPVIRAITAIKPGDMLTLNYQWTQDWTDWEQKGFFVLVCWL
jgi:SET domain-containing protein